MKDWKRIKAEYITQNTSYRQLSQKYNVSISSIHRHSADENWIELKEQYAKEIDMKTLKKAANEAANNNIDYLHSMIELSDGLDEKIQEFTNGIKEIKTVYELNALASAIKTSLSIKKDLYETGQPQKQEIIVHMDDVMDYAN